MTPKWLLEEDIFLEGNPERMMAYAIKQGWEARWVKYIPFHGGQYDQYQDDDCVIVYGSLNLTRQLIREKKWIPCVWCDHDILKCSSYYSHWGKYILQQDYAMYTLAEVNRNLEKIIKMFGIDNSIFIRPDNNYKSFSGSVVNGYKWQHWYDMNTKCYNLEPTLMCIVAKPQKIDHEHRFVIADKKVVTGSKYIINGELFDGAEGKGYDKEAAEYAEMIANSGDFQPHRIYCMDICSVNNEYRLMEIGSVNSCGLYGCDLEKTMDAMARIAMEEWMDFNTVTTSINA